MSSKRGLEAIEDGGRGIELRKVGEVHTRLIKEVEGLEIIKKRIVHKGLNKGI